VIVGFQTRARSMGDLDPNAILWPSRDELDLQTQLLAQRIKQLAADWFNSDANTVSQDLLTRWDSFVQAVKAWDWGPAFLAHLIDARWRDELLAYQKQFNGLRDEFVGAGVQTGAAAFTFTPAAPSTLDKLGDAAANAVKTAAQPALDLLKVVEYSAIGLGVLGVIWLFYTTGVAGKAATALGGSR
jgi:hypothetical protein